MKRLLLTMFVLLLVAGFALFGSPEFVEAGRGWCRTCGPFG